jgi:HD domain
VGKTGSVHLSRYLPGVLVATAVVVGSPVLLVLWLRSSGTVTSTVACVAIGIAMSLCVTASGSWLWQRQHQTRELLFGELMVWGFVRRWRAERQINSARELLSRAHPGDVSPMQLRDLTRLTAALEAADPYSFGHSRRVARNSWMIARRMGLAEDEAALIRVAAAVHDVGKVRTPIEILRKPDRLSDAEFEVMKRHPVDGETMVDSLGDARLSEMVRQHHERLDGSGYPDGRHGQDIALGARIIAVADTFDAITSSRPYRSARSHRQALAVLHQEADTKVDPQVVHAFEQHYVGRRTTMVWTALTNLSLRILPAPGRNLLPALSGAKMATMAAVVVGATATAAAVSPSHSRSGAEVPRQALHLVATTRGAARQASLTIARISRSGSTARASAHRRTVPSVRRPKPAVSIPVLASTTARAPASVIAPSAQPVLVSLPAPPRASVPVTRPVPPAARPPSVPAPTSSPNPPPPSPAPPNPTPQASGNNLLGALLEFAVKTVHGIVCNTPLPCLVGAPQ